MSEDIIKDDKIHFVERSEQIQDIIERMPKKFGWVVAAIVFGLLMLLFILGWAIQYPDTVSGSITISAKTSPIKLVSNVMGRINLIGPKPGDLIQAETYIAVIQNPANTNDILKISNAIKNIKPDGDDYSSIYKKMPKNVSLGEIHTKYYTFLNNLQKLSFFKNGSLFLKQQEALRAEIAELLKLQQNNNAIKMTRQNSMSLFKKMADRDSLLLLAKAGSDAEKDNSYVAFLRSKENYHNILSDINSTELRLNDDKNKLEQITIKLVEEEGQISLDFLTSLDELKDNIRLWEQRYVFKAPIAGRLEYLKFWSNNQQIQVGDETFSIIPKDNHLIGHMYLPAQGAGKVLHGHSVLIKLDNYPHDEFGVLKGTVSRISQSSNTLRTSNQNLIETYLVEISIPTQLITNYGAKLDLQSDFKGTADIIIKHKKLIERFFDNLRSSTQKS